jgi:flagellar basal body rod protein FlgB
MNAKNSRKLIIKLVENGKFYLLYNDGSIVDDENNVKLDKEKDKLLINKIMDKFKHGFSDDIKK